MPLSNHLVTLTQAAEWTKNYRTFPVAQLGSIINPIKAEMFDADAVEAVLDQTGCKSIRMYYGIKKTPLPEFCLIIVGVDANGDDMVNGIILDISKSCPPHCSSSNALNS